MLTDNNGKGTIIIPNEYIHEGVDFYFGYPRFF